METEKMTLAQLKNYLAQSSPKERLALIGQLGEDSRKSVQQLAQQLLKQRIKEEKETARLETLWHFEKEAWRTGHHLVAGTDEVGRGPLAGPVVAAAVILPEDAYLPGINDSKKLTPSKRETLYEQIINQAVCYAISEVDNIMIDQINILEASRLAMAQSVEALAEAADFVLLDGWDNPRILKPHQAIIQGDGKSISIAAASILAKVHRDHLMESYDSLYPGYGFAQHKGYPTAEHYQALKALGCSPIHRTSFNLKLED